MSLMNCAKSLQCLLIRSFLLVGQLLFCRAIIFSLSLCFVIASHSKISWSVVRSAVPQGYVGSSMILKRCRYALVFPCSVTIAVKLCVRLITIFSLSSTFGKYSLVILPLVVCVCMYVCMYVFMYVCNYVFMYISNVRMCVWMYSCMYLCVYIFNVCMYLFVYVTYVCIYVYM